MALINNIEDDSIVLTGLLNSLLETLQQMPAEITLVHLDSQVDLVIELRQVRDTLKEGLKGVNKILTAAEQHLCQTIANEAIDGISYKHKKGIVTATARGFFSIQDPMKFYTWLGAHTTLSVQEEFVRLANSKKARAELCEKILKEGGNVPPGIKEHIIASVIVRRKNND